MTLSQSIGLLLVSSPLILMFIFILKSEGLEAALAIFGLTTLIVVVVIAGAFLLTR